MILMIDNYDSFTYNIVQYCAELGENPHVIRNDEIGLEEICALNPQKIIISPGPSTPRDAGVSLAVIRHFTGSIPILGVCLGHQAIAEVFGGEVIRAKNMMHGKTSEVKIVAKSAIFHGIPNTFTAIRYHSLIVKKENLPKRIKPTAFSIDDDEIMALEIEGQQTFGVQFHPESIMSQFGREIFGNFLAL
ncbi:MAG: anthranilate synthase component II [Wolinella sp.]